MSIHGDHKQHLSRPLRVYIAGPIAGLPDQNRPAFLRMQHVIADCGHTPVNPHNVDNEHVGPCTGPEVPRLPLDDIMSPAGVVHRYGCYMRADIRALMDCDVAVFLPGWVNSKGAKVEREVALICGVSVIDSEIQPVVGALRRLWEQTIQGRYRNRLHEEAGIVTQNATAPAEEMR